MHAQKHLYDTVEENVFHVLIACAKIFLQLMFSLKGRLFMIFTTTGLRTLTNTRCQAYGKVTA